MVVPWIWYSIWKFWVIRVLVFLVFQVFSAVELISLAKTVNLAVWAFPSNFLYDFTLFVIDMHQNMPISLFKTLFDHFHFHSPAAIIWRVILKLRHMWHMLWLVVYNSTSVTKQGHIVSDSATNACYNYPQAPYFYEFKAQDITMTKQSSVRRHFGGIVV